MLPLVKHWPGPLIYVIITKIIDIIIIIIHTKQIFHFKIILKGVTFRIIIAKTYSNFDHILNISTKFNDTLNIVTHDVHVLNIVTKLMMC